MAKNQETACYTWKELAKLFNFSMSKAKTLKPELIESGAVFYTLKGRPAKKTLGFFPSIIKAWVIQKTLKGEKI